MNISLKLISRPTIQYLDSWLMNLFNDQGLTQKIKVILAGANKQI